MRDKKISVSVRNMVEFILRQGDIDYRYTSSIRAQEGTRIHQKLQKKRMKQALLNDFKYEKEVFLKYSFDMQNFMFEIEGRADGIIRKEGGICIEEIKSTLAPLDSIENDGSHWHWAQAKCYAFIVAEQENLKQIKVMLTYMHVETEESVSFENLFSLQEIKDFFFDLAQKYFKWAEMDYERKRKRDISIKALNFPHEAYRKGQREFAVSVYKTIKQGSKLFAQAPTGTGKTISTLFPSVKAIGEGLADRIFYLTAKTITRQTAEDTAFLLSEKGADTLCVTLTAKDKICFCPDKKCNPRECVYAEGHFDRVNDAVWDIITSSPAMKRQEIETYAKKHTVCPHEFMLDITFWVDIIICDYNYVFDPKIQLKRFFSDVPKENYLFLIDEAHNLVDRSREMYSKTLYKSDSLKLKKDLKFIDSKLSKVCGKINDFFIKTRKNYFQEEKAVAIKTEPLDLYYLLREFAEKMDVFLSRNADGPDEPADFLMEQYFNILDFLKISEFFSERYIVFMENSKDDFSIKLLCMDASEILSDIQKKAAASVFFSATLTPLRYFRDVLGGNDKDYCIRMPSPFKKENLCLIVENKISTKYRNREAGYDKIVMCINKMISAKKGNYFVFFPSYDYLTAVYTLYMQHYPDTETIVQSQGMTEDDRESFLLHFNESGENTLLAFAVMGGIFSEGIDLKGSRLIGAAIVGVGLPLITPERNIMSEYYTAADNNAQGFEYAYTYPGMNKVLQSAGRVIRTETDKGVVILIDDRFSSSRYLELFPPEWKEYIKSSEIADVGKHLEEFWSR